MTTASNEDAAVALQYELTAIVREEIGMNELFASQVAEAITQGLRKKLGGQELYIPAPDKRARDDAIRRDFNGRNLDDVCRKHGLGKSRVYEIVGKK